MAPPLFRYPLLILVLVFFCLEVSKANVVQTPLGPIIGEIEDGYEAYLGIPYAQPPVGNLRWAPPRPTGGWTEPLSAKTFGSVCLQQTGLYDDSEASIRGQEDCLYLNIYRPEGRDAQSGLPVMVWIHGGGFTAGAGSDYDGSVISEKENVIVVTLNYRLGAFGFLAHPQLSLESRYKSGNYGILDQQLALQWVKDNIGAFGGDAEKVTVFGESAGGASVCAHLVSPFSTGLFAKAIIQSGLCTYKGKEAPLPLAEEGGSQFALDLGCAQGETQLECLRKTSGIDILSTRASSPGIGGLGSWGYVHGTPVLPLSEAEAFSQGQFNQVPIINGSNLNEGTLFALFSSRTGPEITEDVYQDMMRQMFPQRADVILDKYKSSSYASPALAFAAVQTDSIFACPALKTAQLLAKFTPVYQYEFTDENAPIALELPSDIPSVGAYHAAELPYIFQTPTGFARPDQFTAAQQELSNEMRTAWGQFARGEAPKPYGLVWPQFDSKEQKIFELNPDRKGLIEDFSKAHQCDYWLALF